MATVVFYLNARTPLKCCTVFGWRSLRKMISSSLRLQKRYRLNGTICQKRSKSSLSDRELLEKPTRNLQRYVEKKKKTWKICRVAPWHRKCEVFLHDDDPWLGWKRSPVIVNNTLSFLRCTTTRRLCYVVRNLTFLLPNWMRLPWKYLKLGTNEDESWWQFKLSLPFGLKL